jgi:hypothetical protein
MKFSMCVLGIALIGACFFEESCMGVTTPSTNTTITLSLAAMGVGGAALTAYCIEESCPASLIGYGSLITAEALADAPIVESGASTWAKVSDIIANLKTEIANGQNLAGLSGKQQELVTTILTSANTLVGFLQALDPTGGMKLKKGGVVKFPHITTTEASSLANMRQKIAANKGQGQGIQ